MKDIYSLADEDILYAADVQDRIDELRALWNDRTTTAYWDALQEMQKSGLLTPMEEWEKLIEFLTDMCKVECALRHDYFATYAYETSKDTYGQNAVDSNYWNANLYEDDLARAHREITLLHVTYYAR